MSNNSPTAERYELRHREDRGIWQIIDRATGQVRSTRVIDADAREKHRALNEAES